MNYSVKISTLFLAAILISAGLTNKAHANTRFYSKGDSSELSGVTNNSVITPSAAPASVTGTLIVKGGGSVNFAPAFSGNGVFFLDGGNQNVNSAAYRFTGTGLGGIFDSSGGAATFHIKSAYSFAERQALASPNYRTIFDVVDGSSVRLYNFIVSTGNGVLRFSYRVQGSPDIVYTVPAGEEDILFGKDVILQVIVKWDGANSKLYLNDVEVLNTAYAPVTPNWTSSSAFYIGGASGTYFSSDDIIDEFVVIGPVVEPPPPPPPPSDITPPTVYISSPLSNASVSGALNITAEASDNTAIAGVQFQFDGNNLGAEIQSPPYSVVLNTNQFSLDCAGSACQTIVFQGDEPFKLANGDPSPFRGYADPSLRTDPFSSRIWISYSWPKLHYPTGGGSVPGVDIHYGHSDDNGNTWQYDGDLWISGPDTNKGGSGEPGYKDVEASNIFPRSTGSSAIWYAAALEYFVPEVGGIAARPSNSFRITIAQASSIAALVTAPRATLGGSGTAAGWGVDKNLASLAPAVTKCNWWNEPSLHFEGSTLYLILRCMAGNAIDVTKNDIVVFGTTATGDIKNWNWQFLGKLATTIEGQELGYPGLTQMDIVKSKDGRKFMVYTPDTYDSALTEFVHHGCRAVEVESLYPPLLARDTAGNLKVPISISVSDTDPLGPGSCSYDPASESGILIAKRDFPVSGGLVSSLHRTNTILDIYHRLTAVARDTSGNVSTSSPVTIRIETSSAATTTPDTVPPVVSEVSYTATASGATIIWTTDEPATSQIEYGFTTSYGALSPLDSTLATSHSVVLSGLSGGATYNYRVRTADASGNEEISINRTFTTNSASDPNPPAAIANLAVSDLTTTSANLSWTAPGDDGNTGTALTYDTRYSLANITESNFALATPVTGEPNPQTAGTNQSYVLVGLLPNTTYYAAIKTSDDSGNISPLSNVQSFRTLSLPVVVQPTPPPSSGGGGGGGSAADTTPPPQVLDFQGQGADLQILLTWTNPPSTDYVRTMIIRKEGSAPSNINDGTKIYEGTGQSYIDTNLVNGTVYYYSIFTLDRVPNYSSPVKLMAISQEGTTRVTFNSLVSASTDVQTVQASDSATSFTRNLSIGISGDDVRLLQELLQKEGVYPEGLVTGYFGPLTQQAVIRFQEKYADEILKPLGFITGTGLVGPATRAKINSLLAADSATSFTRNLSIGISGDDVRLLQELLQKEGVYPEGLVTGYFGPLTQQAVIRFQEKYADEILKPIGLSTGTGIVGNATRAKLKVTSP